MVWLSPKFTKILLAISPKAIVLSCNKPKELIIIFLLSIKNYFSKTQIFQFHLPVIGGGSTTVDGPKNEGRSLDVVTGVFKSPC